MLCFSWVGWGGGGGANSDMCKNLHTTRNCCIMHCEKCSFSFRFEAKITLSSRNEKFNAKKGEIMGLFFSWTLRKPNGCHFAENIFKAKPAHRSSPTENLGRTPVRVTSLWPLWYSPFSLNRATKYESDYPAFL